LAKHTSISIEFTPRFSSRDDMKSNGAPVVKQCVVKLGGVSPPRRPHQRERLLIKATFIMSGRRVLSLFGCLTFTHQL